MALPKSLAHSIDAPPLQSINDQSVDYSFSVARGEHVSVPAGAPRPRGHRTGDGRRRGGGEDLGRAELAACAGGGADESAGLGILVLLKKGKLLHLCPKDKGKLYPQGTRYTVPR